MGFSHVKSSSSRLNQFWLVLLAEPSPEPSTAVGSFCGDSQRQRPCGSGAGARPQWRSIGIFSQSTRNFARALWATLGPPRLSAAGGGYKMAPVSGRPLRRAPPAGRATPPSWPPALMRRGTRLIGMRRPLGARRRLPSGRGGRGSAAGGSGEASFRPSCSPRGEGTLAWPWGGGSAPSSERRPP